MLHPGLLQRKKQKQRRPLPPEPADSPLQFLLFYGSLLMMENNAIIITGNNSDRCLRTEFTALMVKSLVDDRKSVNVIGAKGSGKSRLLEDIMNCLPPTTTMVQVNLKSYAENYPGLMREIHRQLNLSGEVPQRLDKLFTGLEKPPRFYLVCFDNYDALLDNIRIDAKYDKDFFDDLNFLKNQGNVSLLCATCEPHNALPVFIAGESYGNSWLILEKEFLQDLTRQQVLADLERQFGEHGRMWLQDNPADKELLLESILGQPFPYSRLSFLVGKFIRQTEVEAALPFKRRLNRWQEEFDKLNHTCLDKRLHGIKIKAEGVAAASGVKKFKIPIISDLLTLLKKKLGLT